MKQVHVGDVMTRKVITVTEETTYKAVADVLVANGVSAVPVVDEENAVLGVVSEADLLEKLEYADRVPHHPLAARLFRSRPRPKGDTAAALMSSPAITIWPGATVSQAARMIDAARVKRLPVVDDEGHLIGIVSRRDLVRLYTRTDDEIRSIIVREVIPAAWIDPAEVTVSVRAGVVTLRGRLDRHSTASILAAFVRGTPGVVNVIDEVSFALDDGDLESTRRRRASGPHR